MTDSNLVVPVILSGGSGTRLWPLSTEKCPKQFLALTSPLSMFQLTLERCRDAALFSDAIIVGGRDHADLAEEQITEVGAEISTHILEPCARNTAPAIALAALACENPQSVLLIMPSDHVIRNASAFRQAVKDSLPLAKARWLVTFGIKPTGPETGYGYIEQGDPIIGSAESYAAQRFVEKPNRENAEKMLAEGGYHWNAGIFLFRADTYLAALKEHAPQMLQAAEAAMAKAERTDDRVMPDEPSFAQAPSDSIDYAIMEKADKVAVTPIAPGWSDVGSWDSLYDISESDDQSNVTKGTVMAIESSRNLIHADELEIATFGVKDLIVVASGKQVMILPRGESQNVKTIITNLKRDD